MDDIIAEGYIGMVQALEHFEPAKGFKFSTYATWWIKALMQEYIQNMISIVRLPRSPNFRKLFFKFNKTWEQVDNSGRTYLSDDVVQKIAEKLKSTPQEVKVIYEHLHKDLSLNTPIQGMESESVEWQDLLPDEAKNIEEKIIEFHEYEKQTELLKQALSKLSPREQTIFVHRRLDDPPKSLASLSEMYNLSRERIRQIEISGYNKIRDFIKNSYL